MSQRSNYRVIAAHHGSDQTFMMLAFAALLVVSFVFALLHAGRQFWRLSAVPDASGIHS